jgi:hypothetical protein
MYRRSFALVGLNLFNTDQNGKAAFNGTSSSETFFEKNMPKASKIRPKPPKIAQNVSQLMLCEIYI